MTGMIRHTHFHDAPADPQRVIITRLGKGELPMDEMFAALVRMGYDGYISGEWFDQMYGDEPDESLANYHEDMTTLAKRHGVTFG